MSCSFQYGFCHNSQRIYMHTFADYRGPVNYHTGYCIVVEYHIFHRIAVKNSSTGFRCLIDQCRSSMNRIHNISTIAGIMIRNTQFLHDRHGFFLYDNIIKHHGTAPHASSRSQFTVEKSHFLSGFSQIISCYDTGRATTNNSHIN